MLKQQKHAMSGVFVFLLLGTFALLSTFMVLMGARAYRASIESTNTHNTHRVLTAYVRSAVRAGDEKGQVRVDEVDGVPVLTLRETYGDESYLTRLYVYEGKLYELFMDETYEFRFDDGEEICDAIALEPTLTGDLLKVRITDAEGNTWQEEIALRGGEGQS
ncbi:MAG: DUF4860 domain-containing protein [Clostridia bacterium]|nr:DUF4860 domain-containing protein [Clostridia bacterium]